LNTIGIVMAAPRLIRRTRLEAKQDTRMRLLAAARAVFLREGFHGASVDMVAAEAGFTKGAVYSTFASKADLFLALYEARVIERAAAMEKSRWTDLSRIWSEVLRRDRDWHLALIEFWVFAARNPAIRKRFERLHSQMRLAIVRIVAGELEQSGRAVPADLEAVTRAQMALGNGFVLEAFLDPGVAAGPEYESAAALFHEALDRAATPAPRRKA
jgi:AcrR family transcriptional regulator